MKIGVSTWVWVSPLSLEALKSIVKRVAEIGFDLIEVPIENMGELDYVEASRVIHDAGLDVSVCAALGRDCDLVHPDRSMRERGVAFIRDCIDVTRTLGGANLVGPFYSSAGRLWRTTPEERSREMDMLIEQLRMLASYAGERQVTLCIEPLNRYETSFLNLAAQAVDLVDRVGQPACQILLDIFHMNIEERSLSEAILAVGPRLHHLHAVSNYRGAPGPGTIPWPEVRGALHETGYAGPAVIESFTPHAAGIAQATATWRALASSQDALAQEGLTFLRENLA